MFIGQKFRLILAAVGTVALPAAALAAGPLGTWMLTDGDGRTDALIHGGSVTTYVQAADTNLQYVIQWDGVHGYFETVSRDIGERGGVYTIDHTFVTTFENGASFEGQHLDGTLDTKANISYATNFTTGQVVKYDDGLFNSPSTPIYNAGEYGLYTITYNSALDTLFLGENSLIVQIDKSGNEIGRFATQGQGPVRCLAYDATDDTLWYLGSDGSTAYQTNANGDNLSTFTVNLNGNYWGGEIAPVTTSTVPGPMALLPFAIGGLSMIARRRNKK
jgi:hypothetical protein